ncbi:glycosyltransferase [bacterium]|nr:glycosyltransferase [bacterium]
MDLSVVIPVWNEELKIAHDIARARSFIENQGFSGEIVVSDDGSTDNTVQVVGAVQQRSPVPVRILKSGRHFGKGHAVRAGVLHSHGDIVTFIDSGGCVSFDDVLRGMQMILSGECDIAHASRYLPGSRIRRHQKTARRAAGFLFRNWCIRIFGVPSRFSDTQCGLKIYRGETGRSLYAKIRCSGFLFDIEVLLHALSRNMKVIEFPVSWKADPDSRLSIAAALPSLVIESLIILKIVARIFHQLKIP